MVDVTIGPDDSVTYNRIGTVVITRAAGRVETYGASEIRIIGR